MYLFNIDFHIGRQLIRSDLHNIHTVCREGSVGKEDIADTLPGFSHTARDIPRAPLLHRLQSEKDDTIYLFDS